MNSIKKNSPPCAEKFPISSNQHGYKLIDPYDWIRDDNWQEVLHSPNVLKKEIRDYIDKENQWTDNQLSNLLPSKEIIFNEIKGCLLYTSPSPRDRTRSRMPSSA